jgi:hypothetical protein
VRFLAFWVGVLLSNWMPWHGEARAFDLGSPAPEIAGGPWLNSKPLTLNDLTGRVVLVEFWTYG